MKRNKRDDSITLAGIRINPRIGVTLQERSSPQECEADLTIWDNFEGAASQDSLESSIDYSRLLALTREIASTGEYSLVETLAYKIVRNTLQSFPVSRVRVKIRKRPASLQGQINYVEVEVEEP
ncbi:MAG: dihydroneopterin aldolase [Acidobacteria bacterium]|nr:dihydroneopterin aldolase [Acidobacteriota bacterium]